MADLAGLPIPSVDWLSPNAPQAFKKFKARCELYFSGPLKEKLKEEQISYLLIWSGDEGIELVSTWNFISTDRKKLSSYWTHFENYLSRKRNFGLSRYKLRTLKQEPDESVDSFIKKIKILVEECKFTNPNEHIVDALIFGSNSKRTQTKLLERYFYSFWCFKTWANFKVRNHSRKAARRYHPIVWLLWNGAWYFSAFFLFSLWIDLWRLWQREPLEKILSCIKG